MTGANRLDEAEQSCTPGIVRVDRQVRPLVARLREAAHAMDVNMDARLMDEAADAIEAMVEERARFPDRPDWVGDMIGAHIGSPVERGVRQHTPGPWVADKVTPRIWDGDPYWRVGVVNGTCLYVGCGDEHDEADAHLIAAAPELLTALRDLEAMAERYRQPGAPIPDAQKKARAAIAKAVGRAA